MATKAVQRAADWLVSNKNDISKAYVVCEYMGKSYIPGYLCSNKTANSVIVFLNLHPIPGYKSVNRPPCGSTIYVFKENIKRY